MFGVPSEELCIVPEKLTKSMSSAYVSAERMKALLSSCWAAAAVVLQMKAT